MVTVPGGLVLRCASTSGGQAIGTAPFMCLDRALLSLTAPPHRLRAGASFSSLHAQSSQGTLPGNVTITQPRQALCPTGPRRRFHLARSSRPHACLAEISGPSS